MMLRLQEQGYRSLTQFGGRAFTYLSNFVMQTAIRVSIGLISNEGLVFFSFLTLHNHIAIVALQ